MSKSDLGQIDKHSTSDLLRRKKPPIFTSHKSYKKSSSQGIMKKCLLLD